MMEDRDVSDAMVSVFAQAAGGVPPNIRCALAAACNAAPRAALLKTPAFDGPRSIQIGDLSTPQGRLATLIAEALGQDHAAMADLVLLVLGAPPPSARQRGAMPPEN